LYLLATQTPLEGKKAVVDHGGLVVLCKIDHPTRRENDKQDAILADQILS
jgi:hypothetical protein